MSASWINKSAAADTPVSLVALARDYQYAGVFIFNGGVKDLLFDIGDGVDRLLPAGAGRTIDTPIPRGALITAKNAAAGENFTDCYGDVW